MITLATESQGNKTRVVISALNPSDEFLNYQSMLGTVLGPDMKSIPLNIEVNEFSRTILEGPNIPENAVIKGVGSAGTTAASGAVDRITHEILLSLDERPTLVAWLFHVRYTLRGTSYLLHRLGYAPQVPIHRAVERDEKVTT